MNEIKNDDAPISGPRRKAPAYYVGETVGRWRAMHPDVERLPNGAVPSKRNKAARRLIRKALLNSHRPIERGIRLVRDMRAQALEVARAEKKSTRWGLRLLAKELAIHQPAYVPETKAARRAAKYVDDAITAVLNIGKDVV
jgi:hypothetical protein